MDIIIIDRIQEVVSRCEGEMGCFIEDDLDEVMNFIIVLKIANKIKKNQKSTTTMSWNNFLSMFVKESPTMKVETLDRVVKKALYIKPKDICRELTLHTWLNIDE
jgi:hypothetical protein